MHRRWALLALLIILGELTAFAQDLRQTAREAVRKHRFAQARELYVALLKREPANLEYLIWLARLSAWLGDYRQAVEIYDGVLARAPVNADALVGEAYVLMWQGCLAAAHSVLERARKAAPDDSDVVEAWQAYARYSQAPKPVAAAATDDEEAATAAVKAHRFTQARELYRKLATRHPNDLDYILRDARITGWLGEYKESARIFDHVLADHPENIDAMVGKADVLLWQGRYREAAALLERAKTAAPNDRQVELALARFYFYQDDGSEASKYLKQVLEQDPHNVEALALQSEIVPHHPWMLQVGFEHDRFSYAGPGNVGRTTIGYKGRSTDFYLDQEVWDWYGKLQNRFGANIVHRFSTRTWVHAGFLYGPGGVTVVPRQDYNVGISQQLPYGLVPSLDYRYLHFSAADVHFIEPGVEYYFKRPIWLQLRYIETFTKFMKPVSGSGGIIPMESVMLQYNQQVAEPLTIHGGYAYGGETFLPYTNDRIGRFTANTAFIGADLSFSPLYQLGASYSYEFRSDNRTLSSLNLTLTIRR